MIVRGTVHCLSLLWLMVAMPIARAAPGASLDLAADAMARGDYASAEAMLDSMLTQARGTENIVEIQAARGANLTLQRRWPEASSALAAAMQVAQQRNDPRGVTIALANEANLELARKNFVAALALGARAEQAADSLKDPVLLAKVRTNRALAAALSQDDRAETISSTAWQAVQALDPTPLQASLLLTIGQVEQRLPDATPQDQADHQKHAFQAYQQSLRVSRSLNLPDLESQGLASLATLYQAQGRYDEAIRLTRRAIFLAQNDAQPSRRYRWQWQLARMMHDRGDSIDAVLAAYQTAATSLEQVRADVAIGFGNQQLSLDPGQSSFRQQAGDLYRELSDLLLERAAQSSGESARADLLAARAAMESLKTAELENYFQSDCATITRARLGDVDRSIDEHTAVLYIIPLRDRTELLISLHGGEIVRARSPATRDELMRTARQFRHDLEDRTAHAYMLSGKQLYDWLIVPFESALSGRHIDSIVFVPDEDLRSIPMSALWDGKQFLVWKYATSEVPGLTLMRASGSTGSEQVLVVGLTESRPGYPALSGVNFEVSQIASLYGSSSPLLDAGFTSNALERQLDEHRYGIVHIATHAEFSPDSSHTALITGGAPIGLDGLAQLIMPSQYRGAPVQLLTLSACETAAGDDRAALGLGGVALKAGAQCALATLWCVNDHASAEIVTSFYRNFHANHDRQKAASLQAAQKALLSDPEMRRYQHPCYWSPYLIIGDWN